MESPYPVRIGIKHERSVARRIFRCQVLFSVKYRAQLPPRWPGVPLVPAFMQLFYFSSPNTPTPLVVPTNTFPFAIIGVMNLFPAPK